MHIYVTKLQKSVRLSTFMQISLQNMHKMLKSQQNHAENTYIAENTENTTILSKVMSFQ